MTPEQRRKFILEQRKKGVSDDKILASLNSVKSSTVPKVERSFSQEIIPTIGAIGGGIAGGIAGAPLGPAGVFGGTVAGSGLGGALGETVQQLREKNTGQRQKIEPGQIVASGVVSGAVEAGTGGLGLVAKPLIKPVVASARQAMIPWVAKISGYADDVVAKALERSPGAVKGLQKGEVALNDVVTNTAKGLNKYANDVLKESQTKIAELTKRSAGGPGYPGTRQSFLDKSRKFVNNVATSLRKNDNIGVTKTGTLVFDRATNPSRIVSGADQKTIQEGFNTLKSIYKDSSIRNIDSVLERLLVLKSKTPVGTPTGGETRKIINKMINEVQQFVKTSPKSFGKTYEDYGKFLDENLPKRIMINEAKEIFGGSPNLSPMEVSKITKRMLQLYNTGNLAVKEGVEKIGETVGQDITGTTAGTLLKTGDQMSIRAQNLTRRGILEKAIEFLPRQAVKNYVSTGKVSGELLDNSVVKFLAKTYGVSQKAVLQQIANMTTTKTTN